MLAERDHMAAVMTTPRLSRSTPEARLLALYAVDAARVSGVARVLVGAASALARHSGCYVLRLVGGHGRPRRATNASYARVGFHDCRRDYGPALCGSL